MDALEAHEKECQIRWANVEARLERGSDRMDRIEQQLHLQNQLSIGVYPFILATVFLAQYF